MYRTSEQSKIHTSPIYTHTHTVKVYKLFMSLFPSGKYLTKYEKDEF
jgi:hypothetical protein